MNKKEYDELLSFINNEDLDPTLSPEFQKLWFSVISNFDFCVDRLRNGYNPFGYMTYSKEYYIFDNMGNIIAPVGVDFLSHKQSYESLSAQDQSEYWDRVYDAVLNYDRDLLGD